VLTVIAHPSHMAQVAGTPDMSLIAVPMLLGNLFGYGLFSILVVQVFMFHHRFPKDHIAIKALVWVVFLADVLIQVFATISIWDKLAAGWGDFPRFIQSDHLWCMSGVPLLCGFVSSVVHIFFCWRIWKLQGSLILPVIISAISLTQCGMAGYVGIHVGHYPRSREDSGNYAIRNCMAGR